MPAKPPPRLHTKTDGPPPRASHSIENPRRSKISAATPQMLESKCVAFETSDESSRKKQGNLHAPPSQTSLPAFVTCSLSGTRAPKSKGEPPPAPLPSEPSTVEPR